MCVRQQVFVRHIEQSGRGAAEIEVALGGVPAVALEAMPVPDRLDIGGIIQRPVAIGLAGLRPGQRGWAQHGGARA